MKRVVGALLVIAMAMIVSTAPASAGKGWCRTDPIFVIDGRIVSVLIAGQLSTPLQVTGPTQVVLTVPDGVFAQHLVSDLGFLRGVTVEIQRSPDLTVTSTGVEIRVAVYVPARSSLPIWVDVGVGVLGILRPESVQGTTNAWITLDTLI